MTNIVELDKYINKYVKITLTNGEGAAGWVVMIKPIQTTSEGILVRQVYLDYGMAFPVAKDDNIKEVEPPEDDPGIFDSSTVSTFEDL